MASARREAETGKGKPNPESFFRCGFKNRVAGKAGAELRAQAMPGEFDRVAAQARSLREWFRGFVQARKGRPLQTKDLRELEPLNRLLERDEGFSQIVVQHDHGKTTRLEIAAMRRWRSPTCTLMFADHTRRRARRWCSMSACGNRAKQAAHRERLKARR